MYKVPEFVYLSVMKLLHRHSQIIYNKIPHFFKMSYINHIQEIQCLGTTICMNNSWNHLFNMLCLYFIYLFLQISILHRKQYRISFFPFDIISMKYGTIYTV